MIPFNKPPYTGNEDNYVLEAIRSSKISGDGNFSKKCQQWFESNLNCNKTLLTTSCTHSLEMAAILLDIKPGDEVIMPSYTFVSTANAFVLRGAKIIFVDIRPDTMNIDETKIEDAITDKTKVIVPVHYAGVACEMDVIMSIAEKYNLFVVEDAAQAMMSKYKNKYLGTIGHLGTFSFHETKNYTSAGEGGLLLINDEKLIERAEIIREKGTNRSQFFRGAVDKYSWVDLGSSYLMNDVSAGYLWGQLECVDKIYNCRMKSWDKYYNALVEFEKKGMLSLPSIPSNCTQNGHMFYIKLESLTVRESLRSYLNKQGILAVFHYIPLHLSPAGKVFGHFCGDDQYTEKSSDCLLRLPLYYGITEESIEKVISEIYNFFKLNQM